MPAAPTAAVTGLPPRSAETKSPSAFRTISEVASDLAVPQHVLRFWESKFQQIRPLKRGGGRRYYRPEDIQLISNIKELLYSQGFTIRGVQKLLRETNSRGSTARAMVAEPQIPASMIPLQSPASAPAAAPVVPPRSLSPEKRREIESVLGELKALRDLLRQSGI
jgi:DNA-binding transcriptional MerR regulator